MISKRQRRSHLWFLSSSNFFLSRRATWFIHLCNVIFSFFNTAVPFQSVVTLHSFILAHIKQIALQTMHSYHQKYIVIFFFTRRFRFMGGAKVRFAWKLDNLANTKHFLLNLVWNFTTYDIFFWKNLPFVQLTTPSPR